MDLICPSAEHLPSYSAALERGWSPEISRPEAAREELARVAADPVLFVAQQVDLDAKGPPIRQPDGTTVPRLPGYRRWMWDGEFCGTIGFRWQPGTTELPPHCLGHIGYTVVPWKRRLGYATRALALILPEVKREGLEFVEITTDVENIASRRVIESNGGVFVERFRKPPAHGSTEGLRFRIFL